MKKIRLFFYKQHLAIAFLVLAGLISSGAWAVDAPKKSWREENLTIRTATSRYTYKVEIAETPPQQHYGLMERTALAEGRGMLFVDPVDKVWNMWMKDTLIPLDMLFIDKSGRIAYIAQAMPNSTDIISAGLPTRAVLEVQGGSAARRGIHVGDHVTNGYFTAP